MLQSNGYERRITEIVLEDIGLLGIVPVTALNSLPFLKVVNFATTSNGTYINEISLPPGTFLFTKLCTYSLLTISVVL